VTLRRAEVERAEDLARQHAQAIARWLRVRAMSPTIADLRRQADAIRLLELRRAAPRLADLTPEQRLAVAQLTESIVNKLLHGPTIALREAADGANSRDSSRRVFDVLRLDRGRHVEVRALQRRPETDRTTRSSSAPRTWSERPGRIRTR
jgi:glutamyl-tRNA reductase